MVRGREQKRKEERKINLTQFQERNQKKQEQSTEGRNEASCFLCKEKEIRSKSKQKKEKMEKVKMNSEMERYEEPGRKKRK